MRTFAAMTILLGIGLFASPLAFADDAKPVTPTPVSTTAPAPLICHTFVHEGMLLRNGECHTQREWDEIRFHSQQAIRDWQQRNLTMGMH